jgi:hypothetical protein
MLQINDILYYQKPNTFELQQGVVISVNKKFATLSDNTILNY